MKKNFRIPLRIVLYLEGQDWVAHSLEMDLMGDGSTQAEAIERLGQAISMQIEASIEAKNWHNLFKPADSRYFAMFAAGKDKDVARGELNIQIEHIEVDDAEAREYDNSGSELAFA